MRLFLNSAQVVGLAFLGLATQAYGQAESNLKRERYEPADSSPAPAWAPYLALGFVAAVGVAAGACWLARRTGCLDRFFPMHHGDHASNPFASDSEEDDRLDTPLTV